MELTFLYLWLKLDTIIKLLSFFSFLFAFFAIALFIWIRSSENGPFCEDPEKIKALKKKFKFQRIFFVCGAIVSLIFSAMLPSSKETAVLVAGHYALQFSKSPEGTKVWTLVRSTANKMLDDAIKSTK